MIDLVLMYSAKTQHGFEHGGRLKIFVSGCGGVKNIAIELAATEQEVNDIVLSNALVQKWIDGKPVKKLIFVKGKMINVVI